MAESWREPAEEREAPGWCRRGNDEEKEDSLDEAPDLRRKRRLRLRRDHRRGGQAEDTPRAADVAAGRRSAGLALPGPLASNARPERRAWARLVHNMLLSAFLPDDFSHRYVAATSAKVQEGRRAPTNNDTLTILGFVVAMSLHDFKACRRYN